MSAGLVIRDATGRVTLDTNTITSRPLGSLTVSTAATNVEVNVPVGAGKSLWVHFYVVGALQVFIRKHATVANRFVYTTQGAGTVYIFYGEC